jgi:outer membrane protein assembly factor BamB
MRKIFLMAIIILPQLLLAQDKMKVLHKNVVVGRNIGGNSAIRADEFTFSEEIETFYIDSMENCIYGQTKPRLDKDLQVATKTIFKFDNEKREIIWQRNYDAKQTVVKNYGIFFVMYRNNESIIIDDKTGTDLWTWNNYICQIDEKSNTIFAYFERFRERIFVGNQTLKMLNFEFLKKINTGKTLVAFDLKTGKAKWVRKIEELEKWQSVIPSNDSNIIAYYSGMHCYNLYNGQGWDYKKIMTKQANGKINNDQIAAVILFGMIGVIAVSSNDGDYFSGLCSNVLTTDSNYYFASKNYLNCVSKNGVELWRKELPENLSGTTKIAFMGDAILLINTGTCIKNGQKFLYGYPYIATILKDNGNDVAQNYLKKNHQCQIADYKILNDKILLAESDRFLVLDNKTLKILYEKKWTKTEENNDQTFLSDTTINFVNSTNELPKLSIGNNIVLQKNDTLYHYSNNELTIDKFASNQMANLTYKYAEIAIYSTTKESFITSKNKNIDLRFLKPEHITIIANKMYYQMGSKICTIALSELLKP